MRRVYAFRCSGLVGFRFFGWQIDYRDGDWLPLGWKVGPRTDRQPGITRIGQGHLTWGPVSPLVKALDEVQP